MSPSFQLALYRAAARLARYAPLPAKAAASLAGRRAATEQWQAWSRAKRESGRRVWVHAASVGEAVTAEPVVRRLLVAEPGLTPIYTHASPTIAGWPHAFGAAAVAYAPPEEPTATAAVFDALHPAMLVFSRGDLWPELLIAAHARSIPVAVLGGTIRPRSRRLAWPARSFFRRLLRPVRFVGAVTRGDAARWIASGVPASAVSVTGDPRHDYVIERTTEVSRLRPLLAWATPGTLVAGSVEEDDEGLVLGAFALVRGGHAEARLVIVPHEPAPAVVERVRERAGRLGVAAETWAEGRRPEADCVVVQPRGLLADLYLVEGLK